MASDQFWFGLAHTPLEPAFLEATQNTVIQRLFLSGHLLTLWNNDHKIGYVWEHTPFRICSNGIWKSCRPAYHFWLYLLPEYTQLKKSAIQAYLNFHPKGLFHLHTIPEYHETDIYKKQFGFKELEENTGHLIFWRETQ